MSSRFTAIWIAALVGCVAFARATEPVATSVADEPATPATTKPAAPKHKTRKARPPAHDPAADRWLHVGGFGEVAVYKPAGDARGLALFASGDGGWNLGVLDMAHEAAKQGYWVAGFSTPQFLKALDAGDGECADADDLLATLGGDLVRGLGLPLATRPVLIGYSSGATVVYAALAADAGHRFGGGVSLGFCPDLLVDKPFCAGRGGLTQRKQQTAPFGYVFDKLDTVDVPWRILQGDADTICDPKFAPEFADGQKDAKAIVLPKVGHGFGVPKNWMPQYRQSVIEVRDAGR